MNDAPTPTKTGLVAMMAAKYSMDEEKFTRVINSTIMDNAPNIKVTNEQIAAFLMVAHAYGLNPLLKQIHCYPAKGGGIVPIISIDGWCQMVNDHPAFLGRSFQSHFDENGKIYAITCTIRRRDRDDPEVITEYLAENFRNTEPWRTMPARMLRHRALIQCARYAFGFSGAFDEGHQILDVDGPEVDVNMDPINRQIAPPPKRTPPPAPNNGKPKTPFEKVEEKRHQDDPDLYGKPKTVETVAHDPETGEIFDGEAFLTDLDDALASAKDKDELATIWSDFEVQANLHADLDRLSRARDLLVWHTERVVKGLKT